jgi:hypothetical protein
VDCDRPSTLEQVDHEVIGMTTAEEIADLLLIQGVAAVIVRGRPDPPLATRLAGPARPATPSPRCGCRPSRSPRSGWGIDGGVGVILTHGSNQQRELDTATGT